MDFDIRNYKSGTEKDDKAYWTVSFLREVDSNFPKINEECGKLFNGINPSTEDAFNNKINSWKGFVEDLQKLCRLYKIKDAKCLSDNN